MVLSQKVVFCEIANGIYTIILHRFVSVYIFDYYYALYSKNNVRNKIDWRENRQKTDEKLYYKLKKM